MSFSLKRAAFAAALIALPLAGWTQTTITLEPSRDTSLFAEPGQDLSNALGPHLYAGQTNNGDNRRALLAFDFSTIPVGSTINSATLTLNQSMAAPGSTTRTFTLHRVNGSWGEGTSNAGSPGGTGDTATAGDATWTDRIFGSQAWINAGGDFVASPSSTADILSLQGPYDFTGLASDVQAWIGGSAVNDGWILIGEEDDVRTAYRFDSRENPTPSNVPQLTVTYTAPVTGGGGGGNGAPNAVPGPGPAAIVLLCLAMVLVSRRWF